MSDIIFYLIFVHFPAVRELELGRIFVGQYPAKISKQVAMPMAHASIPGSMEAIDGMIS
jgi:hypothetical protein